MWSIFSYIYLPSVYLLWGGFYLRFLACLLIWLFGLPSAQLVKNSPAMQEAPVWFLGQEDPLEKGKATHSSILVWRIPWTIQSMGSQRVGHDWVTFIITFSGLPDSLVGKESTCNARDPGLIPGSGRSAREGISYPLQYSWASCMTQLVKNLPAIQETLVWFLGQEDPLEKEKTTHSSILAWRIPWTMGSQIVRHDWTTFTFFLSVSLVCCSFVW